MFNNLFTPSQYALISANTTSLKPYLFRHLENMVNAESFRGTIHAVLQSLQSTRVAVQCIREKTLIVSSFVFSLFISTFNSTSNATYYSLLMVCSILKIIDGYRIMRSPQYIYPSLSAKRGKTRYPLLKTFWPTQIPVKNMIYTVYGYLCDVC